MIRHLILFNAREGATDEDVFAMAEKANRELSRIPGVTNVTFGYATGNYPRYRYTLEIDFASEDVIESYRNHPIHVKFADEDFRPMAPDRITTDFVVVF